MKTRNISPFLYFLYCLAFCFSLSQPSFAQTNTEGEKIKPSMAVKRIALVDLDGVLRTADANNRVRELLDEQRAKFQEE